MLGQGGPEQVPPTSDLQLDDEVPLTIENLGPNVRNILRKHHLSYEVTGFGTSRALSVDLISTETLNLHVRGSSQRMALASFVAFAAWFAPVYGAAQELVSHTPRATLPLSGI